MCPRFSVCERDDCFLGNRRRSNLLFAPWALLLHPPLSPCVRLLRERWMWGWSIRFVRRIILRGKDDLHTTEHQSERTKCQRSHSESNLGCDLVLDNKSVDTIKPPPICVLIDICDPSQAKLLRHDHCKPRVALQCRHTWGDAPLDHPAAALQRRHPRGRTGVHHPRWSCNHSSKVYQGAESPKSFTRSAKIKQKMSISW